MASVKYLESMFAELEQKRLAQAGEIANKSRDLQAKTQKRSKKKKGAFAGHLHRPTRQQFGSEDAYLAALDKRKRSA